MVQGQVREEAASENVGIVTNNQVCVTDFLFFVSSLLGSSRVGFFPPPDS